MNHGANLLNDVAVGAVSGIQLPTHVQTNAEIAPNKKVSVKFTNGHQIIQPIMCISLFLF